MTARILHIAWAIPCAFVSLVLATATGGHPPGILFLPVAFVIWVFGHAGIWGTARLARRGATRRGATGLPPVSIIAATIGTGLMSLAGFYLLVAGLITGRGMPGATESAVVALVWLAHLAALVGLLLRTSWGRSVAAACSAGWLIVLLAQAVEQLVYDREVAVNEGIAMGVMTAVLATVTIRLLLGRREKGYTQPREAAVPKTNE